MHLPQVCSKFRAYSEEKITCSRKRESGIRRWGEREREIKRRNERASEREIERGRERKEGNPNPERRPLPAMNHEP